MGELRQLKALIDETATSLRSQRDILKTRGMSLPPMAMQAMSALTNDLAKLEASILSEQTELAQLRSLAETSALTNSSLDLDTVLAQAMDVVISLTDAERGYIVLKDPETGEIEFKVARENELMMMPKQGISTPQISQTILNEVLETGEPLLADNAYKDDRLQSGQSIAALALRSVLCVPLNYRGRIIGVVYVDNRLRSGVFEEREKNLLAAFANQASVAIENARLYEGIQRSLIEISQIKELMDNVFASIGSGVITADARHHVMMFNAAAASILRRTADETIGHPLGSLLPGVSANLDTYLSRVQEQDSGQIIDAEMEVPERGRIALSMKLSALKDEADRVQGVAMVMDDLTAQRAEEETLISIKRYLPPAMVDDIVRISQIDLGGERREVTCMFVDVRPVSTFPPDFRPQQIMEQLNVYFQIATDIVHAANGIIDKYMGNEVMALFNTQLNPMEDHVVRAVLTALDIRDGFIELYKRLGIDPNPHYYRVGIHTGVATLGNVGSLSRREFSAIGNTINMSKRFEENSEAGQIIISPEMHERLVAAMQEQHLPIRIEPREPVKLKGIENKVQIYEVFKA